MGKRSFSKIPHNLQAQIKSCGDKPFSLFAVLTLRAGDELPNVPGLDLRDITDAIIPTSTLPDSRKGTWARRNIHGWEIKRDDLPMETKSFTHESPNFGDWSRGSHQVTTTRDVYRKDLIPAYGSVINIAELGRTNDSITLSFELDRIFAKVPDDDRELLFAINIVQESVGKVAIKPSDTPASAFTSSLQVDWELLPIGQREAVIKEIHQRLNPTPAEAAIIEKRMNLLLALSPAMLVTGKSGFARYVGAMYGNKLVVFDNIRYGNAAYIMFDDWERLSKMSRVELINSNEAFERVVHKNNWEYRIGSIVSEYRYRS